MRIDQIKNHSLSNTLDQIEKALHKSRRLVENDTEPFYDLSRLLHIVSYIRELAESADPLLRTKDTLDTINSQLIRALRDTNRFNSNKEAEHLTNANIHLDLVFSTLSSVDSSVGDEFEDFLRKKVLGNVDVAKSDWARSKSHLDQFKSEIEQSNQQLRELTQTIKSEKTRLDRIISQHQQQFSESQNALQQSYNKQESDRTKRFEKDISNRKERFDGLDESSKERVNVLISQKEEEFKNLFETSEKNVQELEATIEKQKDKAKQLVGIIAGTGMAGGYQKDADIQVTSYVRWNIATLIGFSGLLGFSIWLFFLSGDEKVTLVGVSARFTTIIAFGLFATYASRMAMKHRESEREHRHKQLALESVNSFIENLGEEEQKKIKLKIADEFFSKPDTTGNETKNASPNTIDTLLRVLQTAIGKLR